MDKERFLGQASFAKGLEDVIVCESKIGYVDGAKGWLVYRGYEIADLVKCSTFEETAYLTIFGKLPRGAELEEFTSKLSSYRSLPEPVHRIIRELPQDGNAMASLRTAFSALGSYDNTGDRFDHSAWTEIGIKQVAQMGTAVGAIARHRKGLSPLVPDSSLCYTANLLYMISGRKPDDRMTKVMDAAMILHIDHEMNASTFASMAVASSLADMYSAITAGLASLKGPLHGGANETVLRMLLEIGVADRADAYLDDMFARKKKISGFGHRVYKTYDPRAVILKKFADEVSATNGTRHLYEIAQKVEERVVKQYGGKGIFPNVDFFSGIIYYSYGIDPGLFTPLFAASRVVGWVARILEYLKDNRLFRPRALYTGDLVASYTPLSERV
ncbi:MAG: citrate synthase/methylcitrate synthase [Ignavibacteriae bacterium]|nr:citrate synthase/methylcitrate synthase [Ignavibacteriota bacterium]